MAVGLEDAAVEGGPAGPHETFEPTTGQLVVAVSLALVAAHTAFRGWALLRSWFYFDDYRLLFQADESSWGWGYLSTPFDSQFMPVGRALVKVVGDAGRVEWALAASMILAVQVVASLACLWMLLTLFGARWAVVALLALYLACALTMPALMWWAAALNQVPLQAVIFGGVAAWTLFLRTHYRRWLVLTVAILTVGFLSYVKVVLLVPVLAYLLLAYFTQGGLRQRVTQALRNFWPAAVVIGVLSIGYAIFYRASTPSLSARPSWSLAFDLAGTFGSTLVTGLLGGPWSWDERNPPVGLADPPTWAVVVAGVLALAVVVTTLVTRVRAGRAWVLLGLYTTAAYLLLLTTRAPVAGADLGLEPRYLTDVIPVAVLCVGLALLPLAGATAGAELRPARRRAVGNRTTVALVALVVVAVGGGVLSSATYARVWHDNNPGDTWTHRALGGLAPLGPTAVADGTVPGEVVAAFVFPWNTLARVLPVLDDDVTFPDTAEDLVALEADGTPRRAVVDPVVVSAEGPEEDCGWRVQGARGRTIPLDGRAVSYEWWVRIAYIGSDDDRVVVQAGTASVDAPVRRGLHNLFVKVDAAFDTVTIDGLAPGASMCVDLVEVGDAVPGGPL